MIGKYAVDALLFADEQTILSNSESGLQMDVHSLTQFWKDFRLKISTLKNKVMGFIELTLYEQKL